MKKALLLVSALLVSATAVLAGDVCPLPPNNVIPEFGVIGAALALGGAGYFALRKRK